MGLSNFSSTSCWLPQLSICRNAKFSFLDLKAFSMARPEFIFPNSSQTFKAKNNHLLKASAPIASLIKSYSSSSSSLIPSPLALGKRTRMAASLSSLSVRIILSRIPKEVSPKPIVSIKTILPASEYG